MIALILFICFVVVAVISMVVISLKVEAGLRKQNYVSAIRYGVVVQQLQDKYELHRFGFAQFFKRQYGEMSIFSISMNAIGIFPMLLLLLAPVLSRGGLSTSLFIYSGVGIICLLIVALIAQYLSSQPTAGGLYHVTLRKWGTSLGVLVGGFQLLTQLALLIGYSYGFVYFLTILLPHATVKLQQTIPLYVAVGIVVMMQGILSALRSSYYRFIHNIAMLLQVAGIIVLFYIVIDQLWESGYNGLHMFYSNLAVDGWFPRNDQLQASQIGVMIALVCRLFIGGEASSQVSEETIEPKVKVSWSTLMSTCYSYIIGMILMLLLAIIYMNLGLQSTNGEGGQWLTLLMKNAGGLGTVLVLLALVGCYMSGTTMIQVGARTLMAMARDEVLPFNKRLAQFSYTKQIPQYAMIGFQMKAHIILLLLYLSGVNDLLLMTSLIAVVCYACQLIIVFYFVQLERQKSLWMLEEWGRPIRYVSLIMLIVVATAAGSMVSIVQWLVILLPIISMVIYAVIKKGIATKLIQYDGQSPQDLFEVEGKVPLS